MSVGPATNFERTASFFGILRSEFDVLLAETLVREGEKDLPSAAFSG